MNKLVKSLIDIFEEKDVFANYLDPKLGKYKSSRFRYIADLYNISYLPYANKTIYTMLYNKIAPRLIFDHNNSEYGCIYIPEVDKYLVYGNKYVIQKNIKFKDEYTILYIINEVICSR